jgi:hypothetical protein
MTGTRYPLEPAVVEFRRPDGTVLYQYLTVDPAATWWRDLRANVRYAEPIELYIDGDYQGDVQ